jgi:aspartyl-tRNA(Asn)/glutamyl-tRNA(Gln) amidotransferase subunit C
MPIQKDEVEKIAKLAKLKLTDEESKSFTHQLGAILDYFTKLGEIDTTEILPVSYCLGITDEKYTLREDDVRLSLGQQIATENAPDVESGYFKIPKVIDR